MQKRYRSTVEFLLATAIAFLTVACLPAQVDLDETPETDALSRPIADLPDNSNPTATGAVGDWRGLTNEFNRSHWVRLTADGKLNGRVLSIDQDTSRAIGATSLEVEVFQNGESMGKPTKTNPDGSFTIEGLQPGVYAMIARGDSGFLAYGLQLLPSLRVAGRDNVRLIQAPEAKSTLEIRSAAVPPTFKQLKKILDAKYPEMRSHNVPREAYQEFLNKSVASGPDDAVAKAATEKYDGNDELAVNRERMTTDVAATSMSVHTVYLTDDNFLHGRLYGIDAGTGRPRNVNRTTVYIIRKDRLVSSVELDKKGFFKVAIRRPAVYSLIAAGEDGFGAISFRAAKRNPDKEARRPQKLNDVVHFVGAQVVQDDDVLELDDVQIDDVQIDDLQLDDLQIDENGVQASEEREVNPQLAPQFDQFGNTLAAPFAMALIDDPRVIAQAVLPTSLRRQLQPIPAAPLAAMGVDTSGFIGASAPMAAASALAGSPGMMGNNASQGGFSGQGMGGGGGGFAGGGGGGFAGRRGLGGLGAIAGLAAGITAIATIDGSSPQLMSPFGVTLPPPMLPPNPPMPPPTGEGSPDEPL